MGRQCNEEIPHVFLAPFGALVQPSKDLGKTKTDDSKGEEGGKKKLATRSRHTSVPLPLLFTPTHSLPPKKACLPYLCDSDCTFSTAEPSDLRLVTNQLEIGHGDHRVVDIKQKIEDRIWVGQFCTCKLLNCQRCSWGACQCRCTSEQAQKDGARRNERRAPSGCRPLHRDGRDGADCLARQGLPLKSWQHLTTGRTADTLFFSLFSSPPPCIILHLTSSSKRFQDRALLCVCVCVYVYERERVCECAERSIGDVGASHPSYNHTSP